MNKRYNRQSYKKKKNIPLSQIVTGLISVFLFAYFTYHLVYGELGYFSMRKEKAILKEVENTHEELEKERVGLENRVKRLRSDSLDIDVLDERARDVLGYVKEDEVIIITK